MAWEIKHKGTSEVIASGDDADLRGADLSGANLSGADLSEADLSAADLSDACVIDCGQRSDGYQFFMQFSAGKEPLVLVWCRYFTVEAARRHWNETRDGQLLSESLAIIDHGLKMAAIRGLAPE